MRVTCCNIALGAARSTSRAWLSHSTARAWLSRGARRFSQVTGAEGEEHVGRGGRETRQLKKSEAFSRLQHIESSHEPGDDTMVVLYVCVCVCLCIALSTRA